LCMERTSYFIFEKRSLHRVNEEPVVLRFGMFRPVTRNDV
jgi:hypothetical protein